MGQIADLLVYDGETTPVLHTLKPISTYKEKGVTVAEWREAIANLPDMAQVRASLRSEKLPSGVMRRELRTVVPVMEVTGSANAAGYTAQPKVAFEETFVTISYSHPRSTLQVKRNARMMQSNIFRGNVGTATPVTTGPYIEMVESGILPS